MKKVKTYIFACKDLIQETASAITLAWKTRHTPYKIQKSADGIIITGYSDSMTPKAFIPSEIAGMPVRVIGARAFLQCEFLEEVRIEDGTETIEANAFSACHRLMKFFMADSGQTIGKNAFFECKNIFCMELSHSLRKIDDRAFFGCSGLRDIDLPDSIESIGEQAFYGCVKLKSIHIPLALKHLPRSAFEGCTALEHIYVERGSYADRVLSASPHYCHKLRYIPRI
jgi:hypothetical protein